MDDLPDALVQSIISYMENAKDVAYSNCVSKRWKDSMPYVKSLYFPRNIFEKLAAGNTPDGIIMQMVSSIRRLETLVVYCPFTSAGLASWLSVQGSVIRNLELRMDTLVNHQASTESPSKLDCLRAAPNLETLSLWGVLMISTPNWDSFLKLRSLEIVGTKLEDPAFADALKACPNLTNLSLVGCNGLGSVSIELPQLQQCKLDFYGFGNCSLSLTSPKLESLEVQGCGWVRVPETKCLRTLCIANITGRVYKVDIGKLSALESLDIRGVQWCWDAISNILQLATGVKYLYMKVEFTGESEVLLPFPEFDFVGFFNNHAKLQKFDIHGAMFAALCQKNSLSHIDSEFVIPCLEEVVITVRSPLNAEQKMSTLDSLLKYGKNLKKMTIKILQMKSNHISADDFFEEICRFRNMNRKIICIE
ncbi:F-box/RNI-like superfamily protein [Heracleum sosnowskyi]|uniref:F-box/RNI-like superfamily protein n=1 Tax=Heracleum sosnowskyi TaxID=360622 RepID=A0AAD8N9N3_9APIA|nr:F-box/RNI-like superfamily protein [Heracleum sosnowskyi]